MVAPYSLLLLLPPTNTPANQLTLQVYEDQTLRKVRALPWISPGRHTGHGKHTWKGSPHLHLCGVSALSALWFVLHSSVLCTSPNVPQAKEYPDRGRYCRLSCTFCCVPAAPTPCPRLPRSFPSVITLIFSPFYLQCRQARSLCSCRWDLGHWQYLTP